MDGGLPWSSVITLGVALIALGGFAAKLTQVSEKVKGLERTREKHGERLGELEKGLALVKRDQRHLTEPGGFPRVAAGGRVLKPVKDDDSSEGGDDDA